MISLMDYDPLLKDDVIGETSIDLERRYFDEKWINLPEYPIETRELRKSGSGSSTGSIRLWVEIFNPYERYNSFDQFKFANSIIPGLNNSNRNQRDVVHSNQFQPETSKTIKNSNLMINNSAGVLRSEVLDTNPNNRDVNDNQMQASKV